MTYSDVIIRRLTDLCTERNSVVTPPSASILTTQVYKPKIMILQMDRPPYKDRRHFFFHTF